MYPLVRDTSKKWKDGWCTYPDGFDANPDIEIMCGGENEKTARAVAIWRQGNLLHFGFEQSPAEMNETGQRLLLNSIAYISRFTEDRPIAVTPSVFAAGSIAYPRSYLDRRLGKDGDIGDAAWLISANLLGQLKTRGRDETKKWFAEHRPYLHPGSDLKLDVDQDAKTLAAPIDRVEFFEKTIAALRAGDANGALATRLLTRYAPIDTKNVTADDWQKWLTENRPYLFFSDQGDYRWYIDPLAKKRGIPSSDLRGPKRASS